jgi:beta-aspartyl-peptidase (threonine type)
MMQQITEMQNSEIVAKNFLSDLAAGRVDEAYGTTTQGYQSRQTRQQFRDYPPTDQGRRAMEGGSVHDSLRRQREVQMSTHPRLSFQARPIVLLSAALCLALTPLRAAESKPEDGAAKKAIQQVLDTQAAAWNQGDLKGFMAGYWESPDLSFYSGKDKTRGWQATLERYQKRYQADGKEMGQLTFSELAIDLLGPDSAFVRGRWKVVTRKETFEGLFTLIVKKLPEGWRIVHDHTSS